MATRRQFLKQTARILPASLVAAATPTAFGTDPQPALAARPASDLKTALDFINTGFENASPNWYDFSPDGTINLYLLYDLERSSPNRAAGHFHFRLEAKPGSQLTIEFKNLDNVWNGQHGSIAKELKTAVLSTDGRTWTPAPLETLPGDRVRLSVQMPGPYLYVARVEPYRLSNLAELLASIRHKSLVHLESIGRTTEGRDLRLVQIGHPRAPNRVFIRARAHPWEAGSSWVAEGFIRRLLQGDAEARRWLERYCAFVLPMANLDGVARGRTRFNLHGKDLNRDWDKPADPHLSPENHALEQWLEGKIRAGQAPHLALELHNDGNGQLHLSRPQIPGLDAYLERMATLERLLRQHTWFTVGSTPPGVHNPGTLGEGWFARYGIDAAVHEFNCNWLAGLNDFPSARHWQDYGASLARVFYEYFGNA